MNNKDMIPVKVGNEFMRFICNFQHALGQKASEITNNWTDESFEAMFSEYLSQIKEEYRTAFKEGIKHGMVHAINSILISYSLTFLKLTENIKDHVEFDKNEQLAIKVAEMIKASSEIDE